MLNKETQGFAEIHIVKITEKGDGFAVVTDSGEGVYITPSLTAGLSVEPDQTRRALLTPNDPIHAERGINWRAYYIERQPSAVPVTPSAAEVAQEPPAATQAAIDRRILKAIYKCDMMSTKDVAEALQTDSVNMRNRLDRLHREGKVVRADVYLSPSQGKASRSVWAVSDDVFTPLEDDE